MNRNAIALLALVAAALGQVPHYAAPESVRANGRPINVGYGGNASPFVVDWDGDGKQDLLLGQFNQGKIRFYRNIGENHAPVFGDSVFLQADGADITLSYG